MTTPMPRRYGPWPGPRPDEPERKLRELCDADRRQLHPTTKALAAALLAGAPLPDAERTRNQFRAVLDAAHTYLQEQPSSRSTRAAGNRLTAAIAQLADHMAKEDD